MSSPKYKIVIDEGCLSFGTSVNDQEIGKLNSQEYDEFLTYLLQKIKEGVLDNTISLDDVIRTMQYDIDDYSDHVCDQCGDTVRSTTWNI